MEGYQVSAQCMALVRDNCLLPTKDAPELGYIRESTDKQYVPDVFYKVSQKTFCNFLAFLYFYLFCSDYIGFFFFLKQNNPNRKVKKNVLKFFLNHKTNRYQLIGYQR